MLRLARLSTSTPDFQACPMTEYWTGDTGNGRGRLRWVKSWFLFPVFSLSHFLQLANSHCLCIITSTSPLPSYPYFLALRFSGWGIFALGGTGLQKFFVLGLTTTRREKRCIIQKSLGEGYITILGMWWWWLCCSGKKCSVIALAVLHQHFSSRCLYRAC